MARTRQTPKNDPPVSAIDSIENLVERIGKGEVIFFVGAGFSLDSEGNSATRLMTRLLWRLQAMTVVMDSRISREISESSENARSLNETTVKILDDHRSLLRSLLKSMQRTFDLKFKFTFDAKDSRRHCFWWPEAEVSQVAAKYYESNDWFCATFEKLLEIGYSICEITRSTNAARSELLDTMISDIASMEGRIRKRKPSDEHSSDGEVIDSVPLCRIVPCLFAWAEARSLERHRDAGKALFLDTMGFADEAIMGGELHHPDLRRVENSFQRRLFPRHHVLARLAREGLCPVVLTTNYDLLLEGAWRMAGFNLESGFEQSEESSPFHAALPPSPLNEMAAVTSPIEFVESGKANRTSLVVKVHGCVSTYRNGRHDPQSLRASQFFTSDKMKSQRLRSVAKWEANLRDMVFTYREIQNWRDDSWARDYLATMQRTRSVAFVGYSLQDPVIHDAFRTVYEEMAADQKRDLDSKAESMSGLSSNKSDQFSVPAEKPQHDAPAFFFGSAGEQSFHATEVLHAATWAAGSKSSSPHEHANYLTFSYLDQDDQFPNLDDLFLWTYHRTMRERQMHMLKDELRSVAAPLLRVGSKSALPSNLRRIEERFRAVISAEKNLAKHWFSNDDLPPNSTLNDDDKKQRKRDRQAECALRRRQLQRLVAWTWHFHPALWKEFSYADIPRHGVALSVVSDVRDRGWYQPAIADPGSVAWAVVIELAVRQLVGSTVGLTADECLEPCAEFTPAEDSVPAIQFRQREANGDKSRPIPGEVKRGILPDALRLSCVQLALRSEIEADWKCGLSHEWLLPSDGQLWPSTGEAMKFSPQNLKERRNVADAAVRFPRNRRIITAPPSAESIWGWAMGEPITDLKPRTDSRQILRTDRPLVRRTENVSS